MIKNINITSFYFYTNNIKNETKQEIRIYFKRIMRNLFFVTKKIYIIFCKIKTKEKLKQK